MTSHHDVAARLRERANCWPAEKYSGPHKALDIEAADLLENQAKTLNEAEAEVARLTKRLDLLAVGFGVPDGGKYIADWQTRIAKYKSALAAEARLAGLSRAMTEVRDWLILAGDMTCREIPLGIIARAQQESKDA